MYYVEQLYEGNDFKMKLYNRKGTEIVDAGMNPYCFEEGTDKNGFKDAITHKPMRKVEFDLPSQVIDYKYTHRGACETDIPFTRRWMLDKKIKIDDVPKAYVDIETDDTTSKIDPTVNKILSIGIIFDTGEKVWLHGDEKQMLIDFVRLMENIGMIITYNGGQDVWETRSFDMPYLATRYGIVVHENDTDTCKYFFDEKMRHCAFIDLYQIYKYETSRIGKSLAGGLSLDNVATNELGTGKIKRGDKVSSLSVEQLREYNMRDVELLVELDKKFSFTDLKIGLAQLTYLNLVSWRKKKYQELKPLIMVDQLVLEEGRRLGLVWKDRSYDKDESIVGALVLEPKVGIHYGVQNYDVKQMYPSIMINERLSPDKDRVVVPNILLKLKKMRVELKKRYEQTKSKEDYITQYNYKVLANVFYGAFGNPACRIYSRDLAQAITMRGRKLLEKIKETVESFDYQVVYGDTDSSFVIIPKEKSPTMENIINRTIAPYEIESGEYYTSMLFVGELSGGTKKRYAGLQDNGEIKIVGMESIRRDYCNLARQTQKWALDQLLHGMSVETIQKYMDGIYEEMKAGKLDELLVLSKGVKSVEDYSFKTKDGRETKGLPHVRALKMAMERGVQNLHEIAYVFTKDDVAPVIGEEIPKNIDYELYYQRQVMAVVNPLIKSIQIQQGTWIDPKNIVAKRMRENRSIMDFISS